MKRSIEGGISFNFGFRLKPAQMVATSFLSVIFVGTLLLMLPISTRDGDGLNFVDALFTATSAACVTGLVVYDTGSHFSTFGQAVILIMIQVGGLGIMTMSTSFMVMAGRRMTIKDRVIMGDALDQSNVGKLSGLIKYIVLSTFVMEFVGMILLVIGGVERRAPLGRALWFSAFHSISAFCNAGFSLYSDSLVRYRGNFAVNFIIMSLIVIGGLGFVVTSELFHLLWGRDERGRLSLHGRIVLTVTAALIVLGTIVFVSLEEGNSMRGLSLREKFLASLFQSITPRTAGFNTLDYGKVRPATLFLTMVYMFVGGSPGGTAGGVKTTTVSVFFLYVYAILRSRPNVEVMRRAIPRRAVQESIVIIAISIVVISAVIFSLLVTESGWSGEAEDFQGFPMKIVFEVFSAFGTVGLSTGITSKLTALGRLIIAITMFVGRVGPLTLAVAIGQREIKVSYQYPSEDVMVG
ncbi:MAG: TrkH family potassium uptake protein [bacterium]